MESDEVPGCPVHTAYLYDVVRVAGRRGLVVNTLLGAASPGELIRVSAFKSDGGGQGTFRRSDVEKLSAEFVGMPNENHYPKFGQPITSWQQIPHEFDEYLTWGMDAGCMYCGAAESHPIHINDEESNACT
ncbi:hypothetical protein [Saccharothrix sp. ST-888]|uniref:hypothetical protein n=1 Tax=Saccharothrix sp. ST-888 TaxID=1427391 RepID=UPI0005EC1E24|nr:hypothetical protein [Saccharothrix sp. ST-888]KJK56122.1 hypothetical protein UK12_24595 [Saccharothrix sp. ST-888]